MIIDYKPFRKEVVEIGDIYLAPIGGFSLQPTIVFKMSDKSFSYRNRYFVSNFEFEHELKKGETIPNELEGILIKHTLESLEFYTSERFIETKSKLLEELKILYMPLHNNSN